VKLGYAWNMGALNFMSHIELSVVMPCLNEADTLEACIEKARNALNEAGISGEIIVADNGSTDGSQKIAEQCGAYLVKVPQHKLKHKNGYGRGLMAGISYAKGKYILMADSDDSYDFGHLPHFVEKLREGYDLVQGCRLPVGGGVIKPGAMPWSHRWIGNPLLSFLARSWFHSSVTDINCGMRAFRLDWYESIRLRCTGMEFAAEMIIKASVFKARVTEIPITLYPDGRKSHPAHLKTMRDGWRILRFILLYSPTWLYLVPGVVLMLVGVGGYSLALPGLQIRGTIFDAQTLLFSSVSILCGYQAILYSLLGKTFAMNEGLIPENRGLIIFFERFNLERGILLGSACLLVGLCLFLWALLSWIQVDFGQLNYGRAMRISIPGAMLIVLGVQTILSSFFASVLGLGKV
jgi:glycosyltransferase involved in cell wall biosynthesis